MAVRIRYHYRKQQKEIGDANDKHHSIHDAIAAAEGMDLAAFRRMENQPANIGRNDRKTMQECREEYVRQPGFGQIPLFREE
ncbi:hypothetical protein HNR62_002282 [Oceanisphaera litoralis]|uniref:DUF2960 family protein n=1 Tax=Oceanisphaera litoralis TaxID=225144 RepID=UPI00195B61EA|nr:DUF2960 family protein [Oceanisphaera litoralis]MBM7456396.1 hypothetical protein [Oceanisphaera litoralis]